MISNRAAGFVSLHADRLPCMVCGCTFRSRYDTTTSHFCAFHWRHYLVAKVVERQLLHSPELALWMQCIRTASTADVLMLLALFGDGLVGQVDDIDRRSVDAIIRSADAA